jgi:hypothetical protein
MVIGLTIIVAIVAAMGATIVKVYEWRQDVLYLALPRKESREPNRGDRLSSLLFA